MTLSAISVFARLGNDPWQAAGRLAGLPKPEATESLARITSGWPLQAARTIATGLSHMAEDGASEVVGPT